MQRISGASGRARPYCISGVTAALGLDMQQEDLALGVPSDHVAPANATHNASSQVGESLCYIPRGVRYFCTWRNGLVMENKDFQYSLPLLQVCSHQISVAFDGAVLECLTLKLLFELLI